MVPDNGPAQLAHPEGMHEKAVEGAPHHLHRHESVVHGPKDGGISQINVLPHMLSML